MHRSVATIDSPEFINLQPLDINPLMSSCEIKVFYLGENRNHSFISKEVATDMAKTLRGAPIVGYFRTEKEDFADHGQKCIIDDQGVHFECMTKPYGFVAPDAKVWFQKFEEDDEFGNKIEREYLMTTGYLWTGQFEECSLASTEEGRPHSMELDKETVEGHWATNNNTGLDFFIINDAIISKLCILGEDVEPCFEGSSVKAPEVSKSFSLDKDFTQTLFTMMQELQTALEGGQQTMENIQENVSTEEVVENFSAEQGNVDENASVENQNNTETEIADSFKKEDEEEKKDKSEEESGDNKDKAEDDKKDEEEDKKKKDEKYALLQSEYSALETKYNELQEKYEELRQYKLEEDRKKKSSLIDSFTELSENDKKDVTDNIDTYTYEDIESKLSVIFTRIQRAAAAHVETEKEEEPITTFNVDNSSNLPDWVAAACELEEKMNK